MELLSPAGNIEKLGCAYAYGADAAYIGLKQFSLRVKADNFYGGEYVQICSLKETYPGRKLYCALNISFHNQDIDNFIADMDFFKQYPIDAFIVQDMGIVSVLQRYFPDAALHLSTQANCINREAVKFYKSAGFSRIVLGRETSLEEIREIKDAVPEMELEVFVHGAMCIAYSGRCLMSAYMNGRSANGGFCSHSCRWDYGLKADMRAVSADKKALAAVKYLAESGALRLEEKKRPGEYLPVYEGDGFTAILSSKDLCMVDRLADLRKAGADSLKIEGRMKSVYYTALVTRAYRKAIDALEGRISQEEAAPFVAELYKASHREFGTGFYYGREDADKTASGASESPYELAALIGRELDKTETENLFARAAETAAARVKETESLHPSARAAKERDISLHPEKYPPCAAPRENWKLYSFESVNKIYSDTDLECVAPDTVSLKIPAENYVLIDPESGTLMDWVCHGHACCIMTDRRVEKGQMVRVKNQNKTEAG